MPAAPGLGGERVEGLGAYPRVHRAVEHAPAEVVGERAQVRRGEGRLQAFPGVEGLEFLQLGAARHLGQDAADALFRGSEILAPMVRASTTPLRTLALAHGASLTFTEEIIDRAVRPAVRTVNAELGTVDYRVPLSSYSAKVQRRMAADSANPDSKSGSVLLRIDPAVERNRLVYQIGTGESALALEAASKVVGDVSGIDVNMGCPKKFSVGGGMGSALLGDERRACDIISTLRRNIAKPVSAKIRLLDPDRPRPTLDFVRALVNAGANAVTIHGRIVGDEAHVDARWVSIFDYACLQVLLH